MFLKQEINRSSGNAVKKLKMKSATITILILFILFVPFTPFAQNTSIPAINKVLHKDLKIIIGEWTGSLTYLDYKTGKPYTMPADLIVKQGKNENQLLLLNKYPNEPKANNSDKVKIRKNGTILNKSAVTSREIQSNNRIQITTEKVGKDDSKIAVIRYIYLLGKEQFTIRKEVQFEASKEWIKRSEFNYTKRKK